MDKNKLITGIVIFGAGILVYILANELQSVYSGDFVVTLALIIRFASYICVVAGCILGIIAVIE